MMKNPKDIVTITWDTEGIGHFIRDNGTIGDNVNTMYSDYLPVKNCAYTMNYTITDLNVKTIRVHGYNSNKQWVSMLSKRLITEVGDYTDSFEVPVGTQFIRLSVPTTISNLEIYTY